MEATKTNFELAQEILNLLAENNCTARQATEILSYVGTTIKQTAAVQRVDVKGLINPA